MLGRPTALDSQRRKGKFLELMAEGTDPVEARKRAGVGADRALRIVTESSFAATLRALQAGRAA